MKELVQVFKYKPITWHSTIPIQVKCYANISYEHD